jgi:UDP-glucose 4-epimerase
LRLGDLDPIDDDRWVRLDVTNSDDAEAAMQGIDAVVHLAIAAGHEGVYEDTAFNQLRFDVNVRGTWTVLNAARNAGVQRFVHTSSLMVVWGYPPPTPVAADATARPVGTYALTKHLAEQVCEHFARAHGLPTICLRIAKPIDPHDNRWKGQRLRPQWIPFPDLVQAYRRSLTAPNIDFETITIVGQSEKCRWDLSKANEVIGYNPTCRLEDFGFVVGTEDEPLIPNPSTENEP